MVNPNPRTIKLPPAARAKLVAAALFIATPVLYAFEGNNLQAYLDPVGIPTICAGLTAGVRIGDSMTTPECDAATQEELGRTMDAVLFSIDPQRLDDLPPTRLAAFASFTYNVGTGAFRSSTLLRKFNAGDIRGACDQMLRWDKATYMGQRITLRGLTRRRVAERELCLRGL